MISRIETETVKAWLEQYNSAVPVAETAFPPRDADGRPRDIKIPFIVFLDDVTTDGGDYDNAVRYHDLSIEYYSEDGDDSAFTEWLYDTGLHFTRSLSYIQNEQLFESVFDIDETLFEKEVTSDGSSK